MTMFNTYDHTKVNITLNGVVLTDFNGDVTIEKQGDDWAVVQGSNGAAERSKLVNNLYTVTLPMMQTSNQLTLIEGLRVSDENANAGPFPFSIMDLNGSNLFFGKAWVQSMGTITKGREAVARTVTLAAQAEVVFEGA